MATLSRSDRIPRPRGLFHRFVAALSQICGALSAAMIVSAVAITCQMIFVRFVLNQSTIWQTEVVVYLMIGATMIGLPYVQLTRGHVSVDLLPNLLSPRWRIWLAYLVYGLSVALLAVLVFHGYEFWHLAWSRGWTSDTVWSAKLWVPYLALPVGFSLYLLQTFSDLIAIAAGETAPFDVDDAVDQGGA